MQALKAALRDVPPEWLQQIPPPSVEEIAAMQQEIEDLSMFGRHHCGTIQRGRTRTGVFGETVTEVYCPACDGE